MHRVTDGKRVVGENVCSPLQSAMFGWLARPANASTRLKMAFMRVLDLSSEFVDEATD